jgi:ferredoxin
MLEMPGTEKVLKDGKKTKPKKRAVFVLEKCVGCGRCFRACKFKAIDMPGVKK